MDSDDEMMSNLSSDEDHLQDESDNSDADDGMVTPASFPSCEF